MTDDITLCWHADGTVESFPASDVVIDRLLEIGLGTTSENGVAVVIAKTNGQELVVVIAGDRWCLDWFPLDYHEQGCVGSFHTVAGNQDATDYIVTYSLQGHHGECLASQTILKEDAIRAIQLFLASVQRPDCVQWEMD